MKLIRILVYSFVLMMLLNACQKEYSNESGNLVLPSGTWQFKDSANATFYVGNMDSAILSFSSNTNTQELHLMGTSLAGSQTFDMQLFADTFKIGTYKASLFETAFTYAEPAKTLYQAGQLIGEFTVNITSYSATLVTGTFSGTTIDSVNNLKVITLGKFTSTIGGPNGTATSLGVLSDDSTGNCKPVMLNGTYIQGIPLTSANTVQFAVTVATAGTYTISSNTINGVTFSTTGTFLKPGTQNVVLQGSGTPISAGDQNYAVSYGNSQCNFKLTVGTPATGTLGTGGDCTSFMFAGTYQQGVPLTASNSVKINISVTTPGSYNIITNTSNGVSFSKSGSFTTAGSQLVTLVGTGTPIDSGSYNFIVSFGTSTCNFSIKFLPGVSVDYFPLTANSYWTYGLQGGSPTDSIHDAIINYLPTFGGVSYRTIARYDEPPSVAYDSSYYRKSGSDYYQYLTYSNDVINSQNSDAFPFDSPVSVEFVFLKDDKMVGDTWRSANINGSIGNNAVTAYINMTVLYKGALTVGRFPLNVIKVQYDYMITGISTPLETEQRWFANNTGEVYFTSFDGSDTQTYNIGDYRIF